MTTPRFSPKEKEVIRYLLEGQSNKQIARQLGVSVRTVEFHLSNIYNRLDTRSRTEAVIKLTEMNLRESTGENTGQVLRKPTVVKKGQRTENGKHQAKRSFPMKNMLIGIVAGVILTLSIVLILSTMEILKTSYTAGGATETQTFTLYAPTDFFTPYDQGNIDSTMAAETFVSGFETQWVPTSEYFTQAAASGIYPLAIYSDTPDPYTTISPTPTLTATPLPLPTFAPSQKP